MNMKLRFPFLFLDLDGTLLNAQKRISLSDYNAIRLYRSLGGRIFLASGRSPISVEWIASCIGAEHSYIAFNGAHICVDCNLVYENIFEEDEVRFLYSLADEYNLECLAYTRDTMVLDQISNFSKRWIEQIIPLGYLESNHARISFQKKSNIVYRRDFHGLSSVLKIVVLPSNIEQYETFYKILSGFSFQLNRTPRYIEITKRGSDKYTGLQKILSHLNLSAKKAMSIGDNENDYTMMKGTGFSVAVENATEEIKSISNAIVSSNNNNGVSEAINTYALTSED